MTSQPDQHGLEFSVRPLVRYVDQAQAVLDTHVTLCDSATGGIDLSEAAARPVEVHIQMTNPQGDTFEHRASVKLCQRVGMVRFEMSSPERWWPAGMGGQALYDLRVTLRQDGDVVDAWSTTIGLTSVRPTLGDQSARTGGSENSEAAEGRGSAAGSDATVDHWLSRLDDEQPVLLVNGHKRAINSVVPVDPIDEHQLLPAGGDSLLLVRGHLGSDLLYKAADRAGILMLQALGTHRPSSTEDDGESPDADTDAGQAVLAQVDRLTAHPSLAGWVIPEDDPDADLATRIRELDPTRGVFLARA